MDALQIAAFVLAVVVICVMFAAQQITMKRRLRSLLASRPHIPAAEFGSHHYADPKRGEIATFIIQKVEQLTGYDFSGALPNDRWIEDLHLDELDSLVSAEILSEVERRFGIAIDNAEAKQVKTLGDFVDLVFLKVVTSARPRPFSATLRE